LEKRGVGKKGALEKKGRWKKRGVGKKGAQKKKGQGTCDWPLQQKENNIPPHLPRRC